jgi:hypothetical protein
MMIDSKKYKGIEYVQLDELPVMQQDKLRQTINRDLLIKIMIDGKIVNDCLQFKDYSFWYNSVYRPQAVSVSESIKVESVEFNANRLALTNS